MQIPIYQIDAFTNSLFRGNPAAVCPLRDWLDDDVMQAVAAENNLSETAFFVPSDTTGEAATSGQDRIAAFEIRWFTPTCEVELCGHATLASAFVIFECMGSSAKRVVFSTRTRGDLGVERHGKLLSMDFPATTSTVCFAPIDLAVGLGATPVETLENESHYIAVFDNEHDIAELQPDFATLARLAPRAIVATARGTSVDFVSRYFAPAHGIDEDPVTGSSHCALAPYWSERLGKPVLAALQISRRGGELRCTVDGNRVALSGRCVLYMTGQIVLP